MNINNPYYTGMRSKNTHLHDPKSNKKRRRYLMRHRSTKHKQSGADDLFIPIRNFYNPFVGVQHPAKASTINTHKTSAVNTELSDCAIVLKKEYYANRKNADLSSRNKSRTLHHQHSQLRRYWCIECEPLFSQGNVPNQSYPEYDCLRSSSSVDCTPGQHTQTPRVPKLRIPMSFLTITEHIPKLQTHKSGHKSLSDSVVIPNVGIIALYTTFVYLIGRLLRQLFLRPLGTPPVEEIEDPTSILQIMAYMECARRLGGSRDPKRRCSNTLTEQSQPSAWWLSCPHHDSNFTVEYRTYCELMDYLRCPEKLLHVGGLRADGIIEAVPSSPVSSVSSSTQSRH